MSNKYTHIGFELMRIVDARVSDLFIALKKQPDYSEEDNSFVMKFEARGGEYAPPGALSLKEHDIVHFLCGINFVPFNTTNIRKDGERFLTGFQFGTDPNFTNEHAQIFISNIENPDNSAPEDYKFSERGLSLYFTGIELGREWHKETGLNLQKISEFALTENPRLMDLYNKFWGHTYLNINTEAKIIEHKILSHLNQIRDDVVESFSPLSFLWTTENGRPKAFAELFSLRFDSPNSQGKPNQLWTDPDHLQRQQLNPP